MFDPKDFLTFARSCERSNPPSEAAHRTAISRAYYAAFLSVRDYCDNQDIVVQGNVARSHDNVIRAMWEIPHHSKYDMADELKRLKKLREAADYDLKYSYAEQDSQKVVDDAEDLIEWVRLLPSGQQS